jgi:hypothetical protein
LLAGATGDSGAPARKTSAKREYLEISNASDIAALDRCYPCSDFEKRRHVQTTTSQYESSAGNIDGPKDVGSSNLQRDLMGALNCDGAMALQVKSLLALLDFRDFENWCVSDYRGTSWLETQKGRKRIQAIFLDYQRRRRAAIFSFNVSAVDQNHGRCWFYGIV